MIIHGYFDDKIAEFDLDDQLYIFFIHTLHPQPIS